MLSPSPLARVKATLGGLMPDILSRRRLLTAFAAFAATAVSARAQEQMSYDHPLYGGKAFSRDDALIPPAESEVDFPVTPVDPNTIKEPFRRQVVAYDGVEMPGTIIVDPNHRQLYYILEGGEAIRYGVGVGRAGFEWSGEAVIGMKRKWPRWLPPLEMVYRDENAAKWANGMPGGPQNPLGARALYLYANGEDTLYRIHGTNDPKSIGKALSSGCIRMLNQDVVDLYDRVQKNSRVVVLQGQMS